MPHPSTLEKITARCGEAAVAALNEALLAKAAEAKLVKVDKLRGGYHRGAGQCGSSFLRGPVGQRGGVPDRLTARLKELGVARRTRVPGPDPFDKSPLTCHRDMAATPVRNGQGRGDRHHGRDGHHRRSGPG